MKRAAAGRCIIHRTTPSSAQSGIKYQERNDGGTDRRTLIGGLAFTLGQLQLENSCMLYCNLSALDLSTLL
jgi:hypothetical protein